MTDLPFASIIVPTYNQEQYIGAALESLIAQTDRSWEAIVVNDGSTDGTASVVESYASRDARIAVVHKRNGGVASALNEGLRRARGRWVHWLSSDDLFKPEKLAINRSWIEQHPGTNFFFSYFWLLREATGVIERHDLWGPLPDPEYQILTLFYRNYISGISICVNREAWQRAGFFDETFYYAQDYHQWLRLLRHNCAVFIPEWTVVNRNHSQQGSELFQDACYFDTARAAIEFINEHPFEELVPWVDLANPAAAAAAVEKALEIACDPSAYLYSLGANPALLLRLLEWTAADLETQPIKQAARSRICERIREMALLERDDPWYWMWRGLAAACAPVGSRIGYARIDTRRLARLEHAGRRAGRGGREEQLRIYMRRFLAIDETSTPPDGAGDDRIVLLASTAERGRELAQGLCALGHRPIIVATDAAGYSATAGVPIIPRHQPDRDCLPWLGPVELAVTLDGAAPSPWIDARAVLPLDEAEAQNPEIALRRLLEALGRVTSTTPQRPVVFLERMLWGGGAERVVYDIATHLDRRRYKPVIFTLFDASHQKNLVPNIPTWCVREIPPPPASDGPTRADGPYHREEAADSLGRRLAALVWGGLSEFLRTLTRLLAGLALAPKAHCTSPGAEAAESNNGAGPPSVAELRYRALWDSFGIYRPAADRLREALAKFDSNPALITVMEEAATTAWFAQIGGAFPFIASLHIFESIYLPKIYEPAARLDVEWWAFTSACAIARSVMLPSLGTASDLVEKFDIPQAKVAIIPNPINCALVRRLSWLSSPDTLALTKDRGTVYVHIGRLEAQKDHDLLLAASALLLSEGHDFIVLCVGDGSQRPRLSAEISRLGLESHVFLLGERTNPFSVLAYAHALVLTSLFESFALVIAEAMACGVPVISTDCPAGPREVLDDGACGILLGDRDPATVAAAMRRIVSADERRRLIESGYVRVEGYDVRKIARLWEGAIERCLPPVASVAGETSAARERC